MATKTYDLTVDEFVASGKATKLEMAFLDRWYTHKTGVVDDPICQYRYAPSRKHRADFAWPGSITVLVECEGGVYHHGAHGSVGGILRDIERANLAAANLCIVFRCNDKELRDAETARAFVHTICKTLGRL